MAILYGLMLSAGMPISYNQPSNSSNDFISEHSVKKLAISSIPFVGCIMGLLLINNDKHKALWICIMVVVSTIVIHVYTFPAHEAFFYTVEKFEELVSTVMLLSALCIFINSITLYIHII